MLVAVISDSHNNSKAIEAIKSYIKEADVILFLGDGEDDIRFIEKDFEGQIYAVKGNCDISNNNPNERIVDILGKKIFMCHGHRYNVKNEYNSIYYRGVEVGADIVLFGHSHVAFVDGNEKMKLMNPGSISHGYGIVRKSLGFIEIDENGSTKLFIKEIIT